MDDPRLAEIARRRAAARAGGASYGWVYWLPTACSGLMLLALFLLHPQSALGIAQGSVGVLSLCLAASIRTRFPAGTERARRAVEANEALLDGRPATVRPRSLGLWDQADLVGLAAAAPLLVALILAVPEFAPAWIGIASGVVNVTAHRLRRQPSGDARRSNQR